MHQVWLLLLFVLCGGEGRQNPLVKELLDPEWHELVAAGGMSIGHGRVKRFVEVNQSQPNIPHQACLLPNGKNGHCRHLHYCVQEDFRKDFTKFMDYLCIIQHSSIGVCCPDGMGEGSETAVAGDLPATAPRDENEISVKIGRAETRALRADPDQTRVIIHLSLSNNSYGLYAFTPWEAQDSKGCGLSTRAQSRVVGAWPANPREWPWIASITPDGFEQYCGGALITDRHVLTAAHCTRRWKAHELFVRLGEYDMERTNDSRTYNFKVVEIRQHELYEVPNYHHDIAILKLHRPATFNTYVWPICLPPLGLEYADEIAVVIGWGTEFYGGPHSTVLMEVSVPVWQHETCVSSFSDSVFNETICAGGKEGGKDACQGDSGGPLMYQMSSGRWAMIGVVSWGVRCGEPNHPGLYTRVDRYLDWILRNAVF